MARKAGRFLLWALKLLPWMSSTQSACGASPSEGDQGQIVKSGHREKVPGCGIEVIGATAGKGWTKSKPGGTLLFFYYYYFFLPKSIPSSVSAYGQHMDVDCHLACSLHSKGGQEVSLMALIVSMLWGHRRVRCYSTLWKEEFRSPPLPRTGSAEH